jgi:hypothetical protein
VAPIITASATSRFAPSKSPKSEKPGRASIPTRRSAPKRSAHHTFLVGTCGAISRSLWTHSKGTKPPLQIPQGKAASGQSGLRFDGPPSVGAGVIGGGRWARAHPWSIERSG